MRLILKLFCTVLALASSLWLSSSALADSEKITESGATLEPKTLYQILLADIAVQRGEYRVAARAYFEAARTNRDARLARRAAETAIASKQVELGLDAATLWSELEPDSPRPKQIAAVILISGNRLPEAKRYVTNLLAASEPGKLPGEFLQLNRLLASAADKTAVFLLVKELVADYSALPEAHYTLAQAGFNTGLTEIAVAETSMTAIERALTLREEWEPAVYLKSQLLSKTSPPLAIKYLKDYLQAKPGARQLRLAFAQQLIQQKLYSEGRTELVRLADEWPNPQEMWQAAAQVSLSMKDYAFAEQIYQRLLKEDSSDADSVLFSLAQISEERKRYSEAVERYSAVREGDYFWTAQLRLANVLTKTRSMQDGLAHLRKLMPSSNEQTIQLAQAEAALLRDAEQYQSAYDLLERALAENPDAIELMYDLAMAAEKLNKLDVLEANLKRMIKLKPDSAHAHNALGYTLADRTERLEEALHHVERAYELSPNDPFIQDSLGWVHYRLGNLERSVNLLRRALAERPDPEIAAHLGEVLWHQGEREEAQEILLKQAQETPNHQILRQTIERYLKNH